MLLKLDGGQFWSAFGDLGLQVWGAGGEVLGVQPEAVVVADKVFGDRTAGLVGVRCIPAGEAGADAVKVTDDAVFAIELAEHQREAQHQVTRLEAGVGALGMAERGFAVGEQDGAAGMVEPVLQRGFGEQLDHQFAAEVGL